MSLGEVGVMGATKELVIRPLVFLACFWACKVAWDLHKEIRARQLARPDAYPLYSDFLPAVGAFVFFTIAQWLFRPIFSGVARSLMPKKERWSEKVWGLKVIRCCEAVFKCGYHLVMTLWCFTLLRNESWLPGVLGGKGDTRNCWADGYPFQAVAPGMRYFYLTAIGYYMSEAAMILTESRKPDFWEMLLHHVCSCTLVSFSYILNLTRVGSLVLLVHGATDVLIFASKAVVDTPFMRLIAMSYFSLTVAYAWFRVYVFPIYIMRSAWVESVGEAGSANSLFGWGYLNFALCVLLLLHIYWFGLIVKMGCVWRSTGQPRDLQSNLSAMDMVNKKRA